MKTTRIRVIHWNAKEAGPLLEAIRRAGHEVEFDDIPVPPTLRAIRQSAPDAVVIDLSRLPSHGREVATYLRGTKATRLIPIIFVNGTVEKVEATREKLPDALYSTTDRLGPAIRKALVNPPAVPKIPTRMMDRFAGRTAAQKLGIRDHATIALIDPPRDYAQVIGELPPGAAFQEDTVIACAVTLWFVTNLERYRRELPIVRDRVKASKFWIIFPKQSAAKDLGINQNLIRETALDFGLVDYKICSVNRIWSGMLFAWKK